MSEGLKARQSYTATRLVHRARRPFMVGFALLRPFMAEIALPSNYPPSHIMEGVSCCTVQASQSLLRHTLQRSHRNPCSPLCETRSREDHYRAGRRTAAGAGRQSRAGVRGDGAVLATARLCLRAAI